MEKIIYEKMLLNVSAAIMEKSTNELQHSVFEKDTIL